MKCHPTEKRNPKYVATFLVGWSMFFGGNAAAERLREGNRETFSGTDLRTGIGFHDGNDIVYDGPGAGGVLSYGPYANYKGADVNLVATIVLSIDWTPDERRVCVKHGKPKLDGNGTRECLEHGTEKFGHFYRSRRHPDQELEQD